MVTMLLYNFFPKNVKFTKPSPYECLCTYTIDCIRYLLYTSNNNILQIDQLMDDIEVNNVTCWCLTTGLLSLLTLCVL